MHNGLRAFSRAAAAGLDLRLNRMAHASELMSWLAGSRLRWREVPVRVIYTNYSLRKGQSMWNLFNILWELLMK